MLVKFLAHGTGSAAAAADYLFGERDAAGQPREGVPAGRSEGGGQRRTATPIQPGSGHACRAPQRGAEL